MRRLVLLAPALALFAGCTSPTQTAGHATTVPSSPSVTSAAAPGLPPEPQPVTTSDCPYLKTSFVADANGQHVTKVQLSADKPPTCFFYRPDGHLQLTVQVYVGQESVATALVNHAAPIDSSNPANEPSGWKGGYQPAGDGVVYAVSKGGSAVIVTSNQKQSIKARTVAKQAISSLQL